MRRVLLAVVLAFFVLPATAASADAWVRPVPGAVARPFEPPPTRYAPGHLGVDFGAPPGAAVRAVGPGTVVFAGAVAGALHVVVRHANGWRTSYSFLASIRVHAGWEVGAGEIVGTAGGRGEHHDGSVLHLGLRIGDTYADPMQLFGGVDLPAVVHLVPTSGSAAAPVGPSPPASTTHERRGVVAGLPVADNPLVCVAWTSGWCGS